MNHDRSLPQELVATAIWEDSTTYQSKKYLATALLQLRTVLHASLGAADALEIDPLFVRLNTSLQPRSMPTS
jgi:DNA-binding SARP family transcriptional activator